MTTNNHDLTTLHETYIAAVNRAVADGRDDLAAELADRYADEALGVILTAGQAASA